MKELLKALDLDAIYGLDAETYWASDYSLSHMATTEYVTDPRFELQMMAIQRHDWDEPKVLSPKQFAAWAKRVNWARTGFLAHHTQFDGYLSAYHYGLNPAFYFDTMSMGRPLLPIRVGGSLHHMAQAFGLLGKTKKDALLATKGKRLADFTPEELEHEQLYAGDDIRQTWAMFRKLLPYMPVHELRLIDMTIRMYAQPSLMLDVDQLAAVRDRDVARKQDMLSALGVAKKQLTSGPKFAALLQEAGCEPPTKISVKQSEKAGEEIEVLALSKQDQCFVDLLGHSSKRVRDLVAARFAVASNQLENRCNLLIGRSRLPAQPVYLNYYGAKTGRWSGGDEANWQNLSSRRREGGMELRASVMAPPGHVLIIADLRQIEARISAWFAGQNDVVEAFRAYDQGTGPDVYRVAASNVHGKPVDDVTDDERFIGKTCELALAFQAGALRYARMLRIGALGPPVDCTDEQAAGWHRAWRAARPRIVLGWRSTHNKVKSAFGGGQVVDDGCVSYEGVGKVGWMHLPGGMAIRYDDLEFDEHGLSYCSKYRRNKVAAPTVERTRLYGGIEVENRTQALARIVVSGHMLETKRLLGNYLRIAMSTHDEIVGVVPERDGERALACFNEVMSVPPAWARDLPLAVDAHMSTRYDK